MAPREGGEGGKFGRRRANWRVRGAGEIRKRVEEEEEG
jgi:hypothetical protein